MWDAAAADREFRRAIELDPKHATAHHWYATYLMCVHRYPESLAEIERAQALDPASKSVLADKVPFFSAQAGSRKPSPAEKQMEDNEPASFPPPLPEDHLLQTADYPTTSRNQKAKRC